MAGVLSFGWDLNVGYLRFGVVHMFVIMPAIPLLDFSTNNLKFGHISMTKIVDMFPKIECVDINSLNVVLSI